MTPPIDQTSLTAYALGELSGAERAAVAAYLVSHADARQYVADVRATGNLLADELARESFGGLTDLQHAAIEQKLSEAMRIGPPRRRVSRGARWNQAVFVMSLAASIMIVCGVLAVLVPFVYERMQRIVPPHQVVDEHGSHGAPFRVIPDVANNNIGPLSEPREGIERRNDKFANNDPEPATEDQWVPQPDNHLAASDPGRQEPTLPEEMIGVQPKDLTSAPKVSVAHAPPDSPKAPDAHADPAVASNANASKPPKSDPFANLPPDAQSPDKLHSTVGASADGKLPTGEQYAHLLENPFIRTSDAPVSGFSAGVDTASYSNIRRFLTHGQLPPKDAVRLEEMLNYFPVRASDQAGEGALALQVELGACPWKPDRRLARVCVSARELPPLFRPPVNLVFLIDVSPSMRNEKSKLPLLKKAIRQLTGKLSARDHISLLAYTHEPGIVLPPTAGDDRQSILIGVDRLESGGKIAGGQGIAAAYEVAAENIIPGSVNRVVLATDGNWSIGVDDRADLPAIIQRQAQNKVSLTVLGVGMNNLKDETLQKLAEAGNGSYAYIDTLAEAKKVLADQVSGSLVTVAKDVKVQVTFNPAVALSYRLLGYERRALSPEQLKSQSRVGGELGAGQSVTALYEVIPVAKSSTTRPAEMMRASVSFVEPTTHVATTLSTTGEDHATPVPRTSNEFRFAAAVAEFGLMLRDSDYKGNATWSGVLDHAHEASGPDETGYRAEFISLIKRAKALATNR